MYCTDYQQLMDFRYAALLLLHCCRFRSMAPMYYRGAKAALIVFDLSKGYTVQKLARWRHDLLQYAEEGVVSWNIYPIYFTVI
jgi:Ras family